MKTTTMSLAVKGLAMALTLATPSLGWTADHILSLTGISTSVCVSPGVTQTQAAVINGSGLVTTPLILSGLQGSDCTNLNNGVNFNGTLSLETANTKLCKPGTKGGLEWLDEGSTIVGANGTLTATVGSVAYQVAIPAGTITVKNVSGTCSPLGQTNYTVTRATTTTIAEGQTTLATASVVTASAQGPIPTIPEPGTLSLIGLGLAGLGWMGAKRARKTHKATI